MFSSCESPRPQPLPFPGVRLDMSQLTPAEKRVAAHVLQGMSNKEIAEALNRAPYTIKVQVATLLRKLGVINRLRFIACYYQGGGLPDGSGYPRLPQETNAPVPFPGSPPANRPSAGPAPIGPH